MSSTIKSLGGKLGAGADVQPSKPLASSRLTQAKTARAPIQRATKTPQNSTSLSKLMQGRPAEELKNGM
jgi:hypothetical protein